MTGSLEGLRVLVVEDEYFVAQEITRIVRELGAEVVGPVGQLAQARDLVQHTALSGAILDVRLHGEPVYTLAEDLLARGVPIILMTGYDTNVLPKRFRDVPQLSKPAKGKTIGRLAEQTFRR